MARLFQVTAQSISRDREGMRGKAASICLVLLCAAIALPVYAAKTPSAPPNPKPAQLSISGYGLLGNRQLKAMLRTLELGGSKPEYFGAAFIEDSALILSSKIKRDGYLEPKIDISLRLADGEVMRVDAAELLEHPLPRPLRIKKARFHIRKGVLYHFQHLDIGGLTAIGEKQARGYFMGSETLLHPKSARIFTPDRLRQGLTSLSDALDRLGYREAKVEADRVVRDAQSGSVDVHIQVRQGPRFFARSVREEFFYGTNQVPASNAVVRVNKPYSRLWEQDFALTLKTNLYHRGYPDTTVQIKELERSEQGDRVEMDLLARVNAGEQFRIGKVEFSGARHTRKTLLSRVVKVERGELLDPIRVEEGRYRLSRLGVFQSVDLEYKPDQDSTRDVLYELTEGKRWNLSLLFGYGSYELLRGGVDVEAFDLWGLAHHAELRAIQSFKATSGNLTYTIPELIGRDIDLFVNGSGLRREETTFTRLEYGGGIGLHKYFRSEATDLSARYNYQILSANQFNSFEEVASEGLTNPAVGSVTFEIKNDRRDNPLYPRRGYKVFATVETATSYIGGEANYERIELSPSWHHPLGGGRYLSLGLSHGVDVTFGSVANNLPFNRRFFPGGENSIRGYTEGEASPRNAAGQFLGAETYTLGTVELEQALTPRWSLVLFSDNLGFAQRVENYPWDTGLFSVGLGIRWRTLIGPVRLEYGYNLNPRPEDPTGTLQFSLGFPF